MSTRWYPLFQKGNPQLRVFLPNFWMKLVRPAYKQPPDVVQFITSIEMTDHDIRNYLEKIYKIPIVEVRSEIVEGEFRRAKGKGYIIKDDDFRRAFVTLKNKEAFEFPDICQKKIEKDDSEFKKIQKETQQTYRDFEKRNKGRTGLPGWFSL